MSDNNPKIMIVDDEQPIRKLLRVGLVAENFTIIEARNGKDADEIIREEKPDLVILDLGLPDTSGQILLKAWRDENINVPVIVLSSRTDEQGIVQALEAGADDYITKPFGMRELAARLRVALRHRLAQQGESPIFRTGDLSVDLVRRVVKVGAEQIKLTPKEYDIIRVLAQYSGRVLTHNQLLREVWGDVNDVQYLRVYVRQIRKKLGDNAEEPRFILTETGVGYRMAEKS